MGKTNDDLFELLASNKKRREDISLIINKLQDFPALCFAKSPLREGDYWENVGVGKKQKGTIPIIDLPTDLGLKESVVLLLLQENNKLQEIFDSYTIKK